MQGRFSQTLNRQAARPTMNTWWALWAPRTQMGTNVAEQRALIVDDSDVLRRLIEMCLRPAGFKIASASTGAEAIAVAAEFDPDLVLLDIGLPDMTGWDVLAALRESTVNAHAKVMILSGFEDVHVEAKHHGADGALIKPFRNDELRRAAVALLAAPSEAATAN